MPPIDSPPRPTSWPALPSPADRAELRVGEVRAAASEPRAGDPGTAYRRVREEAERPAQSVRSAGSQGNQAGEGAVMRLPQSTWEVLSGYLATPGLTIERHEWVARAYRSAADAGRTAPSSRLADLSI